MLPVRSLRAALLASLVVLASCASDFEQSHGKSAPPAEASRLVVEPRVELEFRGRARGPFLPAERIVTLHNASGELLEWRAESDAPWLALSARGGALGAQASTDLWAMVDSRVAGELAAGVHLGRLTLREAGAAEPAAELVLRLDVRGQRSAQGRWELEPAQERELRAVAGEPLRAGVEGYRLTNDGAQALAWSARSTAAWLDLRGATRGRLEPGASVALELVLDAQDVPALPAGTHAGTLEVRLGASAESGEPADEARGGALLARTVRLVLEPPPASDGWTRFVPSVDTRVVHVSSATGDDANDGLSPERPLRSLAAGVARLRDGMPDWLLLRRGERWQEPLGKWTKSGRSAREPMLVGAYGDAPERPLLATGAQTALWSAQEKDGPATIAHVAFVGLHLRAEGCAAEPLPYGIAWRARGEDLLFEDLCVEGYFTNVAFETLQGRSRDLRLRRSVVVDACTTSDAHAQGLYAWGVDGLLVEECLFDHNGWSERTPGAQPDLFRHDLYVHTANSGVRIVGNVIANAASHGLQLRCGGLVEDNLFVGNAIGLQIGSRDVEGTEGIRFEARGNVFLEGRDIDLANPRGFGVLVMTAAGGVLADNLLLGPIPGHFPVAIVLYEDGQPHGLHELRVERNVVRDWGGPLIVQGKPPAVGGIALAGNDLAESRASGPLLVVREKAALAALRGEDNRFWSRNAPRNGWVELGGAQLSLAAWLELAEDERSRAEEPRWPAPGRTLALYHASLGGAASSEAFLAGARAQARGRWRSEYTARDAIGWIRAGFDVDG